MATGFTLKGQEAMAARLRKLAEQAADGVKQALRIEAELVMTTSKRDFVPVDLGALRASGHVEPVKREAGGYSVEMGYGGAAAAYAMAVHETPSGYDPPSWEGKVIEFSPTGHGSKYLERPLMDAIPGMGERVKERVKRSMEGAGGGEPAPSGGGEE